MYICLKTTQTYEDIFLVYNIAFGCLVAARNQQSPHQLDTVNPLLRGWGFVESLQ